MRLTPFLFLMLITPVYAATVALDVGHFHAEPGATSARGRPEFEFNRDLALDIRAAFTARGMTTMLVGADGSMAHLSQRTAAASRADFLLSVHHDSTQPQFFSIWDDDGTERLYSDRYAGFSLFVSRRNVDLETSLRCASAIGAALRAGGFTPSLYHAEQIPGESKPFADRENGVHYYDNLVVLHTARSPAVLFEAGVIVNRDEELKLAAPDTRHRLASAVAQGLSRCVPASRTGGNAESGRQKSPASRATVRTATSRRLRISRASQVSIRTTC
jgi:N-acetylmuramoyl-L-alanine amidase